MKLKDVLSQFKIYTTHDEDRMLEELSYARPLSSFNERDQFIIEGLIRKSLVIKIGESNPRVIANDAQA
jgi:hypothetical protein